MGITATQEKESAQLESSGVPYYVRDDTGAHLTQALAVSAAQGAALIAFGALGEDFRFKRLGHSVARVSIQYSAGSLKNLTPPEAATASYTFNFRSKSRHFLQSLVRVRRVPPDAPDYEGVLNVQGVGRDLKHLGITVPVPTITDRITYQFPNPVITPSYRDAMRNLFDEGGAIASDLFLGQPRGTMRIVECVSTVRSSGDQTISFGFAYLKNKNRMVGDLDLGEVNGHDVFWTRLVQKIEPGPGGKDEITFVPSFSFVEEVFPYADFATMGLPSVDE